MDKYIKINQNNDIIDVFFNHQKSKFDGTEILLETTDKIEHKINGKSISNEYGVFIFQYINESIINKKQSDIDIENVPFIQQERLQVLQTTDTEIQERGIDDILEMLIAKGVITEDDIPNELKTKYNDRKALRDVINE